jgi:hypothetical protein
LGRDHTFRPFATIEQISAEHRYHARAIVVEASIGNSIVFNSYHEDYKDAERRNRGGNAGLIWSFMYS